MTESLRNKIRARFEEIYLLNPDRWIYKDEVCEFAKRLGYNYGNGERTARELESGKDRATGQPIPVCLERKEVKGKEGQWLTYYRYKPSTSDIDWAHEEALFNSLPDGSK